MSTAILITIGKVSANPGAAGTSGFGQQYAGSQNATLVNMSSRVMEVTPQFNSYAGSAGAPLQLLSSGTMTGSWPGNTNTFGALMSSPTLTGSNAGIVSGSWLGNTNTIGVYQIPYDVHWDSPISTGNPEELQSADLVGWNFFPTPTPLPPVATIPRDRTRYKKTYSSQRQQVRRIRIVKK